MYRTSGGVSVLCGLLVSGACASSPVDEATETVICRELAFAQSAADRDGDRWVRFLADEAVFLGQSSITVGPAAVRRAWHGFLDQPDGPTLHWYPDTVTLDEGGNHAVSQGPYWMAADQGYLAGRFRSVWEHVDGQWLLIFDGGLPPAPAAAPPERSQSALAEVLDRCGDEG